MKQEKDKDQAELELRIMKDVNAMPQEVQDRFKAIVVGYHEIDAINDEQQLAERELELKYEKLYQQVYEKRAALLRGVEASVDAELVAKFDERAEIFKDAEFGEVEVEHVEVKDIQNIQFGVPSFWMKALLNNKNTQHEIYEKDRAILSYLQDIKLEHHESDFGFELTFIFEKNSYFNQTELKKRFFMEHQQSVERAEGTVIEWKDPSCDVTKTKKKKGKGKKKSTVVVKQDSFFNFFETVEEDKDRDDDAVGSDDDEDEAEDSPNAKLQQHLELGQAIKDDIVPLALEFFLGVVEQDSDDDMDMDGDDDDDDDEDEKPKKKGKKGDGAASDKKQEECKQQ